MVEKDLQEETVNRGRLIPSSPWMSRMARHG